VDNLASILAEGGLWCDARLATRTASATSIGIGDLQSRRLMLPVKCYPGDLVGGYVPFYFCPRSIMLYLIHRANHPNLAYRGGQGRILHLELDLNELISWANGEGPSRRWAFTLSNGSAYYAEFRHRVEHLDQIDWVSVAANDFSDARVDPAVRCLKCTSSCTSCRRQASRWR
jgi:ssDNA thymidine ADP-ribosyltransferase, DarT